MKDVAIVQLLGGITSDAKQGSIQSRALLVARGAVIFVPQLALTAAACAFPIDAIGGHPARLIAGVSVSLFVSFDMARSEGHVELVAFGLDGESSAVFHP